MTISPPDVLRGTQIPRILHRPQAGRSVAGQDAVDLAALAGLFLDPWQQFTLDVALGEVSKDQWAAYEVGLVVSRQNGKNSILEARELAGLFLFDEKIVHTAQNFDTARVAFRRVEGLIRATPELMGRVDRIYQSNGMYGVVAKSGAEVLFRTRTKGGGRGFSANVAIFDEAMFLVEEQSSALMPIVSAQHKPQVWYVGSALDQERMPGVGQPFARIRRRALSGEAEERLAYLEWSAPGEIDDHDPTDRALWAMANPSLGCSELYGQTAEVMAVNQQSMARRSFAVEFLGIGDWPEEVDDEPTFPRAAWRAAAGVLDSPAARQVGPLALSVEVAFSRSSATIGAAFMRADGDRQVEIVDRAEGTGWVVGRVAELVAKHNPCAVVLDPGGPSGDLVAALQALGLDLTLTSTREWVQSCGAFFAGIVERAQSPKTWHPDEPLLNDAVAAVRKRELAGGGWAWERRSFAADMAPLGAVTLAQYGLTVHGQQKPPPAPALVAGHDVPTDDVATARF